MNEGMRGHAFDHKDTETGISLENNCEEYFYRKDAEVAMGRRGRKFNVQAGNFNHPMLAWILCNFGPFILSEMGSFTSFPAVDTGNHSYRRRLQGEPGTGGIRCGVGLRKSPDGAVRRLPTDDEQPDGAAGGDRCA